jgi:thioredoxin-like negative regulator of GroEL
MDMVNSKEDIEQLVEESEMALIYFGTESCGICSIMKPKVKKLLEDYPRIKSVQVDVDKSMEVSAAYNIFTIPVILLFIEGKEVIREGRHISIQDINSRIERYYNMLFE